MELADELHASLKQHMSWSKPRVACFVWLLLALLKVQRMDLSRLCVAMESLAQVSSRYRRLQRFFSQVRFDYDAFADLIMHSFGFEECDLTLDRTNWKWGKRNLNVLVLAVAYQGTAVPVYWLVLNKQGNSSQRERIALLNRFVNRYGALRIRSVLGDREFIGQHWWQWMQQRNIPFIMRMRANQLCDDGSQFRPASKVFRSLEKGKSCIVRKARKVGGVRVWLSALRLDTGEFLILACSEKHCNPFNTYAKRWEIECLFQALKSRGFDMESTRMTQLHKIKKMMAVLALAFCWAHKTGQWKHQQKPLKCKKHGRLERSYFRYGLDHLASQVHARFLHKSEVMRIVLLLIIPWSMLDQIEPKFEIGW